MKVLLVLCLIGGAAFLFFGYGHHHSAAPAGAPRAVVVGSTSVVLDAVASTTAEQRKGYTARRPARGHGLLFTWDSPGLRLFWMKGTPAPLDLVWVGADRKVLGRVVMPLCKADPCPTFAAPSPFAAAIEAPAGTFRRARPGQLVRYVLPPAAARNG